MTEAEVTRIVEKAVHQTLLTLGIDVSNPAEMQRDFQHLRSWRESFQTVRRQGIIAAVAFLVPAFIAWLILRFKGVV